MSYQERYVADNHPLGILLSNTDSPQPSKEALRSIKPFMNGIPHCVISLDGVVPATLKLEVGDAVTAVDPGLTMPPVLKGSAVMDPVTPNLLHNRLNVDAIEDIYFVCHYAVQVDA
jgi:hypothetical protein